MTQSSRPWTNNSVGDGTSYTAAQWRSIYRNLFGSGVLNGLAVSGTTSPLTVAPGSAMVDGLLYESTANENLTVATPAATTGGHVILRADFAAQTVRLLAVRNTSGATAIPALTQTSETTFEIRLAEFQITSGGNITLTPVAPSAYFRTKIASAQIDDLAIITARLADQAVTTPKLADLGVTTPKVANDAIDDTKAGNRVPQFYRRQGGDATEWGLPFPGTTNYTPGPVRMQAGFIDPGSTGTITFPVAFSARPLVFIQSHSQDRYVVVTNVQANQFSFRKTLAHTGALDAVGQFAWLAIGPE